MLRLLSNPITPSNPHPQTCSLQISLQPLFILHLVPQSSPLCLILLRFSPFASWQSLNSSATSSLYHLVNFCFPYTHPLNILPFLHDFHPFHNPHFLSFASWQSSHSSATSFISHVPFFSLFFFCTLYPSHHVLFIFFRLSIFSIFNLSQSHFLFEISSSYFLHLKLILFFPNSFSSFSKLIPFIITSHLLKKYLQLAATFHCIHAIQIASLAQFTSIAPNPHTIKL